MAVTRSLQTAPHETRVRRRHCQCLGLKANEVSQSVGSPSDPCIAQTSQLGSSDLSLSMVRLQRTDLKKMKIDSRTQHTLFLIRIISSLSPSSTVFQLIRDILNY